MKPTKSSNIVELLQTAYAAELETVENYLANSVWLDGIGAREVSEALAADVDEELDHAKRLARRLKQLGVPPRGSLQLARTQKSLQPPKDSTDVWAVVEGVLSAERQAIARYEKLIKACEGQDYATQDLAVKLLADEEEHRVLFEGFLRSLTGGSEDREERAARARQ